MKPSLITPLLFATVATHGANAAIWTNATGGSWGTAGNWNSAPTFTADELLDFSTLNITGNRITTLDGARTAGSLKFGDATTVSNNWTVNEGSGGPLTLATSAGNPTITTVATNDAVTINASIASTQNISKLGAGTLNLAGANTFTGTFVVDPIANSIVNVSNNQSGATGGWLIGASASAAAVVNFQAGSTIEVASDKQIRIANNVASGSTNQTLNVSGSVNNLGTLYAGRPAILNLNEGGTWTQAGPMSVEGQGGFSATVNVKSGATFTYTNAATVKLNGATGNNGVAHLTIDDTGVFITGTGLQQTTVPGTSGGGRITLTNGGTLKLSALVTDLTTQTQFVLGSGGGVIDTNGFDASLSGIVTVGGTAGGITGTGGLTKAGAGTLTLTGANTYTGATTVNGGTLSVSAANQFSDTASLSVTTGATLNLNFTGTETVGAFRIDGAVQAPGTWGRVGSTATHQTNLITGDGIINNTNASAEYYWDGTGTTWSSAAAWSHAAANPATNPAVAPDANNLAIFGGDGLLEDQTIQLGGNRALSKLTFSSPVAFTFTGGGTNSILTLGAAGIILDASSAGATFGSATAGQQVGLVLGVAQTWTNLTTTPLNTVNGVSLGSNLLTTAGTGDFVLGGAVTGTGGMRKLGAGALTLDGTNSFTGDKTVDRGGVIVVGNQTAATGSWILRGYGDSGTTYNTAATTVTLDSGSTHTIAAGKTIQLGNNTPVGGFQPQTLSAYGTVTNNGTLFAGRSGGLNVGGIWTQNGTASIFSQGGGTAAMNVVPGGEFIYTSATPFVLQTSGSNNVYTNLTIDGGVFTTGVNIHNPYGVFSATMGSKVILTNGGKIKLSANVADFLTTAGAQDFFEVGSSGGIVDTNGFSTTLKVAITGMGGLTKAGAGTLTTTGTNSHTGDTTVEGGVLSLAGANLDDAAAVTIAAGAQLNLNFAGSDTVAALTINGTSLPDGTYNSSTHPAAITGTGSITVGGAEPSFASWATDLGLSGSPDGDFDNDGLADVTEYVLGSNPKATSGSGIVIQKPGDNLIFTFSRVDASETPDLTLTVQAGALGAWPQAFQIGDTAANSSAGVAITENGADADTITVTIPTGAATQMFARLKVVVSGS